MLPHYVFVCYAVLIFRQRYGQTCGDTWDLVQHRVGRFRRCLRLTDSHQRLYKSEKAAGTAYKTFLACRKMNTSGDSAYNLCVTAFVLSLMISGRFETTNNILKFRDGTQMGEQQDGWGSYSLYCKVVDASSGMLHMDPLA